MSNTCKTFEFTMAQIRSFNDEELLEHARQMGIKNPENFDKSVVLETIARLRRSAANKAGHGSRTVASAESKALAQSVLAAQRQAK